MRRGSTYGRLLAVVLTFSLGTFAPTAAQASVVASPSEVNVDTSELGDAFAEMGGAVAKRAAPLVEEAGYTNVRVRIFWKNPDEFHYAIAVALDEGANLEDAPVTATCRDCNSSQLEDAAIVAVETAIAQAKAAPEPEPVVAPEEDPVEEDPSTLPPSPPTDAEPKDDTPRRAGPLGTLGKVGIAGIAIGLPVLGTGVAFVVIKEKRPDDDVSMVRDFRPSGWALLGTGAALAVTGAILLIVDRTSKKRSSKNTSNVAPWVSPSGLRAGVGGGVMGRF